ncbi:MAG: endonuclease/exonuclease/phosphatase family protein [Gemmatimonadetes bacterium]|nr:endonuclease/exonuclease/phosphatase family protein [Gemmatimonadota bacterium]
MRVDSPVTLTRVLLAVGALAAAMGSVSAQPVPDDDAITLDVMTFNIRTSAINDGNDAWPNRKALVAETISRFNPHLLGLQEVVSEQTAYLEEALPGYRWLGVDRGLNGGSGLSEATPIWYRYDELVPIESGTFWLGDPPGAASGGGAGRGAPVGAAGPGAPDGGAGRGGQDGAGRGGDGRGGRGGRGGSRIVTWARFHHFESGRQIYVFNTHFSPREGPQHVEAMARITERLATLPPGASVILMGDFNSAAGTSDAWKAATSQGLRDVWTIAPERRGPPFTSNGFGPPPAEGDWRIDWILVSGSIEASSVSTVVHSAGGRYPSDHYPVVATLRVHPS